jgi:hypothetical protein
MTRATDTSARPLVVELVGPAAVGKSAVARVLGAREPRIAAGQGLWHLPRSLLLVGGLRALPSLAVMTREARTLLWEETKQMVRLGALNALVLRQQRQQLRAIVLDEGPVFGLSWLRAFGHGTVHNGGPGGWWERTVAQYAKIIDLVVLLDAPDPVLAHRMRSRTKPHGWKHKSVREIAEFGARFRRAFSEVLAALTAANGGLAIVTLETEGRSAYEIADRLVHLLEEREDGP